MCSQTHETWAALRVFLHRQSNVATRNAAIGLGFARTPHAPLVFKVLAPLLMAHAGCATVVRHPVPESLLDAVTVAGMPAHIRTWGDRPSEVLRQSMVEANDQAQRSYGDQQPTDGLFLSSGGPNGAYAAGVLCGWTKHGSRPVFRVVAGVSVGAIIAPFAFLGSAYDEQLKEMARSATQEKIFRLRWWPEWLSGDSIADSAPLERFLGRYIDEHVLAAIAAEHAKGRRLFVATSNLDANRPVIWDLGAIASSGTPNALRVLKQVIIASAAVPVLFPPSYIPVEHDGQRYDEMHVDGAVTAQIALYGQSITGEEITAGGRIPRWRGTHYVILNRQISPPASPVEPKLLRIASRSIVRLMQDQGVGDLWQSYVAAQRDGLNFRLAAVPDDVALPLPLDAGSETLNHLFDRGYALARDGYPWSTQPPGLRMAPATSQASSAMP